MREERPKNRYRTARVLTIQALYALEKQEHLSADSSILLEGIERFAWVVQGPAEEAGGLARALIRGVWFQLDTVDEVLSGHLSGWTLDRLYPVDRAILRFGIYSLLFLKDIPPKVSLNECVKLANRFSAENSYRFINGVLHSVALALNPDFGKS